MPDFNGQRLANIGDPIYEKDGVSLRTLNNKLANFSGGGNIIIFSGGTVSGNTNFLNSLSATTYYSGSTLLETIIDNIVAEHSGGTGTPGGLDKQVQFNDGGIFGGNTYFTYDKTKCNFIVSCDNIIGNAFIYNSTIIGGKCNSINCSLNDSTILGGCCNNLISANRSSMMAGYGNTIGCSSNFSTIIAGAGLGMVCSTYSAIIGGTQIVLNNSTQSAIIGGFENQICSYSNSSGIFAGWVNNIKSSNCSAVIGGAGAQLNYSNGSIIGGGHVNIICNSNNSGIIGGKCNETYASSYSFLSSSSSRLVNSV